MFCSTVIPTIGRSTLSRAVCSVLDQEFTREDFEVIVVNDSGMSLREEGWQRSRRVRIIDTNRRERSVARNVGAAIAKGAYLHFLDDDDWMLAGAFESLWQLANTNPAAWLYGGYRLVDSQGNLIEDCYPDDSGNCFIRFVAGEWLPLQVSFIKTKVFFRIGGFASLFSLSGGDEDVDLSRQISLDYDIAGTRNLVAEIRVGHDSSTTDYANLSVQSRVSREKALDAPGAFARLRDSASSRPADSRYWQGRVAWAYLTSVIWNLQQKRFFTSASRMTYGLTGIILAGSSIFSPSFWRGATRPHIANGWLTTKE
jgi:glycosyltransferase involved in cell wall biosynthesis